MITKISSAVSGLTLLLLFGSIVHASSAASGPQSSTPSANSADTLARIRGYLKWGRTEEAYLELGRLAREGIGAEPEQRLTFAELYLELRDYRSAGNLVRDLFQSQSLAAANGGWSPEDPKRHRALIVLGKVLFFLSRAPLEASESREEAAARTESLEWAERAFREILQVGDEAFYREARAFLAQVLASLGRFDEAATILEEHLTADPAGAYVRAVDWGSECVEWLRNLEENQDRRAPTVEGQRPESKRAERTVVAPVKISAPAPKYPPSAQYAKLEGQVVIQAIVDQTGQVHCGRPLKALPQGLTEAALEAVSRWRFKPAELEGRPVKVYYNLTVNFSLQKNR